MICTICKKTDKETRFTPGDKKRCAECNNKRAKEYYAKDPEKMRAASLKRHYENRERNIKRMREYGQEIKEEVYIHYGGYVCGCCGETEKTFLTLDHKNGGGSKHRKKINTGGYGIYRWVKKHGFPPDFQILCFNCNSGRALNGGICPHEKK